MPKVIHWNRQKLIQFRAEYNKAVKSGVPTFLFEGAEFPIGYAKYLLLFLESRIK